MNAYRGFAVMCLLAASVTMPETAAAQALQSPLPVAVGQTVRITSADGKVTKGKIQTLTPASVIFESPGGSAKQGKEPVIVAVAGVSRIQVSDSVSNGVVRGALIGGLVGGLLGATAGAVGEFWEGLSSGDSDFSGVDEGAEGGFARGIATGALLGYAIDRGRMKSVYERGSGGMTTWAALVAALTPSPDLPIRVRKTVWVTSFDGRVTKGKVLNLTQANVEIGGDGAATAHLSAAEVSRIRIPDGVKDGMVKGAISLGLAGAFWGAFEDETDLWANRGSNSPQKAVVGGLVGAAAGGLLGYAIDTVRVKTIYSRNPGDMTVSVRPISSNAGKGLGVRLTW